MSNKPKDGLDAEDLAHLQAVISVLEKDRKIWMEYAKKLKENIKIGTVLTCMNDLNQSKKNKVSLYYIITSYFLLYIN